MHIHPSSPDSSFSEDNAATIIQAGFRGYRVRKQLKKKPSRHRQQRREMENSANSGESQANRNGTNQDGNIEERSATKIQAGIRGFLVRKRQKTATDAATKIQASFRGFKARKEIEKMKQKKANRKYNKQDDATANNQSILAKKDVLEVR